MGGNEVGKPDDQTTVPADHGKSPRPTEIDVTAEMKPSPRDLKITPDNPSVTEVNPTVTEAGLGPTETTAFQAGLSREPSASPTQLDSEATALGNGDATPTVAAERNSHSPEDSSATDWQASPEKTIADTSASSDVGKSLRYLGDYELERKLAQGGMGVVYRARQVSLNRPVAIKLILAGQLASKEALQRFQREAEAVAQLEHPGIVPIYEIGEDQGHHFFSMALIEGDSLAQRLQQGPFPHREAASVMRKVAEAVAYAHEQGIIHRDLKPANILLDRQREPKVIDFGLARLASEDRGLTSTGAVMGTPSYMSPEQAQGEGNHVGPLSDVYSLGAVLYCLLTGRPPFQAASSLDTLRQVLEREPAVVTTLNSEVPRDLETICHKCLQKDPVKRYSSARGLADDLRRWEGGEPITARPISTIERGWRWVCRNPTVSTLIATTLLSILLGAGASLWFGTQAQVEASRVRNAERQERQARAVAEAEATNAREAEANSKASEAQARVAEAAARTAEAKAKRTLARSNYFLALSRGKEGRLGEANELLERIPEEDRNVEWGLAAREFEGSNHTWSGHNVRFSAISPEGTRLAGGGSNNTLKVWDAATQQEMLTMIGHAKPVVSVAFSPDGRRIVSGSEDNTAKVWDATTGQEMQTMIGHTNLIIGVAFSPDGTRIVSGSWDQTLKVWDAATGEELHTLKGHKLPVQHVAYSPDGTRIASGSWDNTLRVWDAATGQALKTLDEHTKKVDSVAFSPDGTRIVSGSWDNSLKVWDVATGVVLRTLNGHAKHISHVAYCPDGSRIVSASWDETVKVWDAETGQELASLTGHTQPVSTATYSPCGRRIFSDDVDGSLKVWDAVPQREWSQPTEKPVPVRSVCFSPDGTRIVSGGFDRSLTVWDAETRQRLLRLTGHKDIITQLTYSPDGTRIVSGSGDDTLKIWDAATGEMLQTLSGHKNLIDGVAVSPDGTEIVSASFDNTLKVWDAATGRELRTLVGHDGPVTGVAYSPNGRQLVSASFDKTLKVWNAATHQELMTIARQNDVFGCVAYSPDGTRIVSEGEGGTLKMWDAATGQELRTLTGHTNAVTCLAYSPDGTRIVSGSLDKTLKIWDHSTGEELLTLSGHTANVTDVCLSPDGKRIISTSMDGTIRVWDTIFYHPDERALRHFAAPNPDWHRQQADQFEASNNLYAALFHQAWLLKIQPDDPQLYDKLHAAHDRWKATTDGKDVPLPPVVREMLAVPRGK